MSTINPHVRHLRHSLYRFTAECRVLSFDIVMGLPRKRPKPGNDRPKERNFYRTFRNFPFHDSIRSHIQGKSTEKTVPITSLLVGLQGFDAREFAKISRNLLLTSTRLLDGPHVQLLSLAASTDTELTDLEILSTPYGRLAKDCLRIHGHFFGAQDEEAVGPIARSFIAWGLSSHPHSVSYGGTAPDDPILVAPIRGTSLYQVVDGHHRASVACGGAQPDLSTNRRSGANGTLDRRSTLLGPTRKDVVLSSVRGESGSPRVHYIC
jgi:hypothetical protein